MIGKFSIFTALSFLHVLSPLCFFHCASTLSFCLFSLFHIRYCPDCKTDSSEVIAAGEKLRVKKKMTNCKRDWGRVRKTLCSCCLSQSLKDAQFCSLAKNEQVISLAVSRVSEVISLFN